MTDERVESGRYLRAIREHWPYILGTVLLSLGAALVFLGTAHKRYDADADVLVTPVPSQTFVGLPLFRESDVSRSVITAARIVTSPQVVDDVKSRLHVNSSRGDLLSHVSVTPQEQSSILTVTGKAATPDDAARIANAFANGLIDERSTELQREVRGAVARISQQVKRLQAQGATTEAAALADQLSALQTLVGAKDPTLQVVSPAVPPEQAAWPRPVLSLAIALLAGLLLGLGIAIAIELVNPLVLAESDVVEPGGPPVLARLSRTALNRINAGLLPGSSNEGPSSIPYRALWANLTAKGDARRPPAAVLVTGVDRKEGSPALAVGLAASLATTGQRVVLVDADTRTGVIDSLLRPSSARRGALRDVLADDAPVDDILVRVLPSGPRDEAALAAVSPERVEALVDELARVADVVVLAGPPLLDAPEALALAEAVDAVVVTVELGRTRRARLAELRRDLGQRAIVPAGFVVVGRRRALRDRSPRRRAPAAKSVRPASSRAEREPTPR
jgi:capsular polysaccharide biosynthesis protein/Mrp family chromosome partitioning ATPase